MIVRLAQRLQLAVVVVMVVVPVVLMSVSRRRVLVHQDGTTAVLEVAQAV